VCHVTLGSQAHGPDIPPAESASKAALMGSSWSVAEIDQIAAQLYANPPDRFVPARDEAAAAAKAAGDAAGARAIAALKKPTVAAWSINLLALRRPDLIDELTDLSQSLSQAQRQLRGDDLRQLSVRRRTMVDTLVRHVRELAVSAGATATKLPLGEVEATFNAALAEPAVAAQVRSGRLLKTTSYAGFGALPTLTDPTAAMPAAGSRPSSTKSADSQAPSRSSAASSQAAPSTAAKSSRTGGRVVRAARSAADDEPADTKASRRAASAGAAPGRAASGRAESEKAASGKAASERAEEIKALRGTVNAAHQDEARASAALDEAVTAEQRAAKELADLEKTLTDLRRRRDDVREELTGLRLARGTAQRARDAAERKLAQAQAVLSARSSPDAAE
jgi:hypothetical protein